MDSKDEKRICVVEKTGDVKYTEDEKPWMSENNGTCTSATVKVMLSLLISSSVSIIAFLLKIRYGPYFDTIGIFYVALILLWVTLMSVIFFNFMWSRVLEYKPQSIKACFAFGMLVNFLAVILIGIYACLSYHEDILLLVIIFIGVFNSMMMFMFHDAKTKKEQVIVQNANTQKLFEAPKYFQILVEQEHGKLGIH